MAADAFTQIRNVLFRDPRLSFRDKGIFGLISTHRDGFGVTAESIAACSSTDGVSAVKTSLRALERYGYLKRTRVRRPDGTLGGAVYYITDQPELFEEPEEENRRSQPAVPQPPLAEPTQVEPTLARPALAQPTVADRPHKKINSKHTSLEEDSLSSAAPTSTSSHPAASTEREIPATPQNDTSTSADAAAVAAVWAAARGGHRNPAAETAVAASARQLLAAGWPQADVTALAEDMGRHQPTYRDLSRHADHWQPPTPATAAGAPGGGRERCPEHPLWYRHNCVECAMAVPA